MYIKKPVRLFRGNVKTKFELMTKCIDKYHNSPSNRGTILLDTLPANVQHSETIIIFAKHVLKVRLWCLGTALHNAHAKLCYFSCL